MDSLSDIKQPSIQRFHLRFLYFCVSKSLEVSKSSLPAGESCSI